MRDNKKKINITQSHKIKIISFIKSKKFRSPEDRPYFEITKNYCSTQKKKKLVEGSITMAILMRTVRSRRRMVIFNFSFCKSMSTIFFTINRRGRRRRRRRRRRRSCFIGLEPRLPSQKSPHFLFFFFLLLILPWKCLLLLWFHVYTDMVHGATKTLLYLSLYVPAFIYSHLRKRDKRTVFSLYHSTNFLNFSDLTLLTYDLAQLYQFF